MKLVAELIRSGQEGEVQGRAAWYQTGALRACHCSSQTRALLAELRARRIDPLWNVCVGLVGCGVDMFLG